MSRSHPMILARIQDAPPEGDPGPVAPSVFHIRVAAMPHKLVRGAPLPKGLGQVVIGIGKHAPLPPGIMPLPKQQLRFPKISGIPFHHVALGMPQSPRRR